MLNFLNRAITLTMAILLGFSVNSQINKYNQNWVFGNYAGVSFDGTNSFAVLGSAMSAPEGVATISDPGTGAITFYSDGEKVWGFNHQLIHDGDNILGNQNSTQSALLIPYPKSTRLFYLFTTDAEGGPQGIKFSILDKDIGNNGGVKGGDKNITLATPVAEKLTVLRHCDLQSYWVVAHEWGSNKFFSWHVTEDGINLIPVETNEGPIYSGGVENSIGYMKPSPKDDMLALAVTGSNRVDLFDFDNITGEPYFMMSIDSIFQPYGVEFSPDQTLLYVSCLTGQIYQFNLQAANIQASKVLVASANMLTGALQIAPDGRIYITRDLDNFLGYFGSPNSFGNSSNYVKQGLYLSGRLSEAGLPPHIPQLIFNHLPPLNVCINDTVAFNPQFLQRADSFIFFFGDPMSGQDNYTTKLPAWHVYTNPGFHKVELIYYMCGNEYSLNTLVCVQGAPGVYLGEDTAICSNVTHNLVAMLSAVYCHTIPTNLQWSNGQTSQAITIAPPGNYSITVSNMCGTGFDSISIAALPVPTISLGPDIELCAGDVALVVPVPKPDSIIWYDGSNDSFKYITTSGSYSATVVNEFNCTASDNIEIVFIDPPEINWIMNDTVICIDHPMELNAGKGFDSYLWQDGSTGYTFMVSDSGWYYVTVINKCGIDTDSMYVHLEDCSLKLYVPNAFTPDADGINDVFRAYGQYIEDYTMYIYNRLGEILFESDDIETGWDGRFRDKPAAEGVYVWVIKYEDATQKHHVLRGTFVLLR